MLPIRDVNPTRIRPVLTWALIAANVAIFLLAQPSDPVESELFIYEYAAIPCEVTTGDPLELAEVTQNVCSDEAFGPSLYPDKSITLSVLFSMFLHGDLLHLLFNMWSLWIFGNNVEEAYGRVGYLAMYLAAGIVATLGFVLVRSDTVVPLVGASGAIAGVMGAYLVLFPTERILSLVFVLFVPVPAAVFIGIWFFSQFAIAGQDTNVAWEAHVFGFLFGVLLTLPLRTWLRRRVMRYRVVQWPNGP